MCAGMLAITKVSRVVFVQRDPAYGDTQNILVTRLSEDKVLRKASSSKGP